MTESESVALPLGDWALFVTIPTCLPDWALIITITNMLARLGIIRYDTNMLARLGINHNAYYTKPLHELQAKFLVTMSKVKYASGLPERLFDLLTRLSMNK